VTFGDAEIPKRPPVGHSAMTMTNGSSTLGGRRVKFTPQAIEKIKDWVVQGVSRDEIANLLDVTVGSLQVTCSRLGISLRRRTHNHAAGPRLDAGGRPIEVSLAHVQAGEEHVSLTHTAADTVPLGKFAIVIRHQGKEVARDVTLTSRAIGTLAFEAMSRDLAIAEFMGQVLVAALKKDMIEEILRDEVPPSGA
jgi:hypothetical protein